MNQENHLRKFGKTGLRFFALGLGTVWFGRKWPMDNPSYVYPEPDEIARHLDAAFQTMGNEGGTVMIDTAAAYGTSEEKLGAYFAARPDLFAKAFIATKWGEEFDIAAGMSKIDHSRKNYEASVERSLVRLGKIDLLYIHGATLEVLRDRSLVGAMMSSDIPHSGASISKEDVLQAALTEGLLRGFDVVQMPAWLFMQRQDLAEKLAEQGKAIVLNSPIRWGKEKAPKDIYSELFRDPKVSVVLTGTRHHLSETVGYVG